MRKILGSWSGMRKYLEEDMLARSLRGRVRYGCTRYVGMDLCKVFEVCIDGVQVKRFSWETVNTYFIDQGYKKNAKPYGKSEYWAEFFALLDQYPVHSRTEYTDEEFCEALEIYRKQDIQNSIDSQNPLVRMFAVLDRRIGKRTLMKIRDRMEEQPEWLRAFYILRLDAEDKQRQTEIQRVSDNQQY